ncbi:MAG TPA: gluconate 2-dehydrogenase subunit 3 family protein [Polyangia bacterium]|nr:gluconate 2-dehydrogenase subunit 3 family protein [Polyangia bacterium]
MRLLITRRDFVHGVVWSSLGGYLVLAGGACRRARAPSAAPASRFFSDADQRTLTAACERILPRDQDPGAIDLGVSEFIDRALAGDRFYASTRAPLREALRALDREAAAAHGRAFAALDAIDQDAALARWEERDAATFHTLLTLTLEGAFSDPIHGGNRGQAGWRLIGFAPDPLRPGLPGLARR